MSDIASQPVAKPVPVSGKLGAASAGYSPKEGYETNVQDDAILPSSAPCDSPAAAKLTYLSDIPQSANASDHDVSLLHSAHHADPFAVLGPHAYGGQDTRAVVIRAWIKDAAEVELRFTGSLATVPQDLTEAPSASESEADHLQGERQGERLQQNHQGGEHPDQAESPASCRLQASSGGVWYKLHRRADWLFQGAFNWLPITEAAEATTDLLAVTPVEYELRVKYCGDASNQSYILHDAYRFGCSLGEDQLRLFQSGSCWHVDNLMGSHFVEVEGVQGVRFAVWAPNAQFLSVVGEFNQWDGRAHPMRKRHEFGVWEIFVPDTPRVGHRYMYKIHTRRGTDIMKIDPYAQEFENPPAHASVISGCDDAYRQPRERYEWRDGEWMQQRQQNKERVTRMPISIYEVHLPSWMRGDNNRYLTYKELAHRLVEHCQLLNFTHVEFLPLAHHPFEGSWGYQVSGLFAPYSRLGSADELKYLIDELHLAGIGVFLDFVPAHFVKDDWALANFDGEPCFEYADPREGEHKTWGTKVFNFRRNEVRSFLLGAGYHWLRRYHVDGLRIDAVSSMLYKNYCRDEWIPNEEGGDANLEAINMLQELNWVIHREFPGVLTMAEEATSWRGVTDKEKGLGFDFKWDLGWMNDTISYLCKPTPLRPESHGKLTFRGLYMAHERWVLPLSHDEVVSGKGSLLDKCAFIGSSFEEKASTLKSLIVYQAGLCGRPLLFMGAEFAQGREWNESRSLDWHEAREEHRSKVMKSVADTMAIYKNEKAMHAGDDEPWNFKWVDCDSRNACLVAFLKSYEEWFNDLLVICNFSADTHYRYPFGVPHGGEWEVLLNTDDWAYGGQMRGIGKGRTAKTTQGGRLGWPYCLWLDVPAWSAMILKAPKPDRAAELVERIRIAKGACRPFEHMERELALTLKKPKQDPATQDPATQDSTTQEGTERAPMALGRPAADEPAKMADMKEQPGIEQPGIEQPGCQQPNTEPASQPMTEESIKVGSTKAESTKAESTKAESTKAESKKAESKKAESTKAESIKAEWLKVQALKLESPEAEAPAATRSVPAATEIEQGKKNIVVLRSAALMTRKRNSRREGGHSLEDM
ncbi:1,4-alpha-glucan branching enzyme [Gregarina niphandrodes]|uniref:1,4-alpha-glucan branching enzyme n=1 Tax=Gregarina niphandrodes TaxID=110365 RepID=A0A023B1M4_GRENI|nr:1,4-alpha-glucan branching enzyme [Gregarina niphandrodes]EZG48351.1 1,4-alpha-glucan branching enzyme [Gregarina niphandrodes]|eukprot:XP_011132100.1 1,4-alpha-glucan branching enzyme [Gregarina niphandrodes]